VWCVAFVFWGSGAFLLWRLWNFQRSLPDPLGTYIEFTIMFLATFYVLVLFPVKSWVNWLFSSAGIRAASNKRF
jgi:hypothetical protein